VIEATVAAMDVPGERLMAWLGPAIGPQAFEVGGEVREAFVAGDAHGGAAFVAAANGKWLCDIYPWRAQRLRSSAFAASPAPTLHGARCGELLFLPARRRHRAHGQPDLAGLASLRPYRFVLRLSATMASRARRVLLRCGVPNSQRNSASGAAP
jgi:copper oxidase (laccase) domain-containing protein